MVLSYSRRLFLRFFPGASMPFFVRGHVEAFAEFGGVPRVLLYDNLKSAVLERQGDVIRGYADLADLNRQAAEWTATAAVDRPWVEDRTRTVLQAFEEDRSVLIPLPHEPFPAHERVEVEVGKTPYVPFDLNDYSIPHDRIRRTLVVYANLDELRVADGTLEFGWAVRRAASENQSAAVRV